MTAPRLPRHVVETAYEAVERHGSAQAAARALGMPVNTLKMRYDLALKRYGMPEIRTSPRALAAMAPPLPRVGFEVTRHAVELDEKGSIKKQWVGSKPPPGEVFEPLPGQVVRGESALLDPDGRILAKWVKTRTEDAQALLLPALERAFERFTGVVPKAASPPMAMPDLLTVYPLPDLHLGMRSWAAETGDNYDLKIATQRAVESIANLAEQSRPSQHAVLLVLGDYLHTNDQTNATPRSKHTLDVDGRWPKIYDAGAEILLAIIQLLLRKHDRVELVVIPGNHDQDAAPTLRVALRLAFRNEPRLTVNRDPGLHWYRLFGRCLLGATHGHTMKPDRMAMMLAADRPRDWGHAIHRSFFFGHVHHESAKEVGGVRVESFSTLASRDGYAAGAGYRSGQALTAITYHATEGEIGRHRINFVPGRPRVRVKAKAAA